MEVDINIATYFLRKRRAACQAAFSAKTSYTVGLSERTARIMLSHGTLVSFALNLSENVAQHSQQV